MSSQEWRSFRRLVAWLCSLIWIFLTIPIIWIEIMAIGLLSLAIRTTDGSIVENLGSTPSTF